LIISSSYHIIILTATGRIKLKADSPVFAFANKILRRFKHMLNRIAVIVNEEEELASFEKGSCINIYHKNNTQWHYLMKFATILIQICPYQILEKISRSYYKAGRL
jgi:hypothetical protein